jgi:uncharacterized protein YgiM (DUF1202 family)
MFSQNEKVQLVFPQDRKGEVVTVIDESGWGENYLVQDNSGAKAWRLKSDLKENFG